MDLPKIVSLGVPKFQSLSEFMQPSNPYVAVSYYLMRRKAMVMQQGDDGAHLGLRIHWEKIEPRLVPAVEEVIEMTHSANCVPILAMGQAVMNGLKVYRPSVRDCEALEQIEPHLPPDMYRQPYPVMLIDLPREYSESRRIIGRDVSGKPVTHRPLAIFSYFSEEHQALMLATLLDNAQFLTLFVRLNAPDVAGLDLDGVMKFNADHVPRNEVGEHLRKELGDVQYEATFATCTEEAALHDKMVNLGVCANMLFVNYGVRLTDPNPSYRERLQKSVQRAQKQGRDVSHEVFLNRIAPKVMSFSQEISLYRRAASARTDGPPTGRHVKPHWRKGHLRNQRVGKGRQDRKIVFVQAVLVNAEDFAGDLADTKTVYKG